MSTRDIQNFIESIDPETMRDGRCLRDIAAAKASTENAHRELITAIKAARAAGDSWTMIGVVLGTSKQNAHRKYAHLVEK